MKGWGKKGSGSGKAYGWGAATYGGGKGAWGGKSTGKGWNEAGGSAGFGDEGADYAEGGGERTNRIWARYQFPKAILRNTAGRGGSVFVKEASQRQVGDDVFLSDKSLKKALTTENSHLLRRPGVGVSEIAGSVLAGVEVLDNLPAAGLGDLGELLHADLAAALQKLNTEGERVDAADFREAFATVAQVCAENEDELKDLAVKATIAASRLYIMGANLLQLLTAIGDPKWWAQAVPDANTDHSSLQKWKQAPKSAEKMAKAIAHLLREKVERDESGKDGSVAGIFGRKAGDKKSKKDDSSSSPSSSDEKKCAKKKKSQGKAKKGKKSKKDKSSSSSSSSDEKKRAKKKKEEKAKKDAKKGKKKAASPSDSSSSDEGADAAAKKRKSAPPPPAPKKEEPSKKGKKSKDDASQSSSASSDGGGADAKPNAPKPDKTAALASWSSTRADELEARVVTMLETLRTGGKITAAELQEVLGLLPQAVASAFGQAGPVEKAMALKRFKREPAESALNCARSIATAAQAFYGEQAGALGGAGAAGSGGAAAPAAGEGSGSLAAPPTEAGLPGVNAEEVKKTNEASEKAVEGKKEAGA